MEGFKQRDVPYANVHEETLLTRVFIPDHANGHALVMVHGGAWTANDRITPTVMCGLIARAGFTVFSLDFRCGPTYRHPAASADIAAGIRYVRSNCEQYGIRGDTVGIIGSSSGGHLALFVGCQPDVAIHQTTPHRLSNELAAVPGETSAEVAYVVALWPVSNPLYRYEYAKRTGRSELIQAHDGYFATAERMSEASIPDLLRDQRHTHLPHTLVVQPGEDANVPEEMTLDLLAAIQEQEGMLVYRHVPKLPHAYAYELSEDTVQCSMYVLQFIEESLAANPSRKAR